MLVHRHDLASYDHNDFPGVVPRTFLGAAVVAAVTSPAHAALELLFSDFPTRLASQVCTSSRIVYCTMASFIVLTVVLTSGCAVVLVNISRGLRAIAHCNSSMKRRRENAARSFGRAKKCALNS